MNLLTIGLFACGLTCQTFAAPEPARDGDPLPQVYSAGREAIKGAPTADDGSAVPSTTPHFKPNSGDFDFLEGLTSIILEKVDRYQDSKIESWSAEEWDRRAEGLWVPFKAVADASHWIDPARFLQTQNLCVNIQ